MRQVQPPLRTVGILLLSGLFLLPLVGSGLAQQTPALGTIGTAPADTGQAAAHGRLKHPSLFAVSAAPRLLLPVHILKEEVYDINDLTSYGFAVSGDLRIYPLDQLSISFGGTRGGYDFLDSKPGEMALINNKLPPEHQLTPDAYLRLDGGYVMVSAYIGNGLMPESRLNPYITAGVLYIDWAMLDNGRDGSPLVWQDKVMEGTDWGVGAGFGTEYRLGRRISLDLQLIWNYILTGDEIKWEGFQAENESFFWTNTHMLSFSLGMIWNI